MKKIIALILSIVCVFTLVACGDEPCTEHVDANTDGKCDVCEATVDIPEEETTVGPKEVAEMYAESLPTKVVTTTKQVIGENIVLNGKETLVTGKVNGKLTTVYEYERDELNEVPDSDIVPPLIKTVSGSKVYHDGKVSIDGGSWVKGYNFAPLKGDIAINLDEANLTNVSYDKETSTLSFTVAADKVALVFGENVVIESDVTVSIVNDGAVVTGISLSYVIAGTKEYPEKTVTIDTVYTYDLEEITLD